MKFDEDKIWGYPRQLAYLSRPWKKLWSAIEKPIYEKGTFGVGGLTLPDFLGLGAPQSGSTWLHANLGAHPGIYLPEEKELHFFDRNFHKSLKTYARAFEPAGGRLKGEIPPGYSVLAVKQIRFIHSITPKVRLIYLLRNPVDQRLSMARRVLGRRYEDPFRDLAEGEVFQFLEQVTGKKGRYDPGLRRHNYVGILRNWWSVFPREQMYLGFFEDVVERPLKLIQGVLSHIGAPLEVDWSHFPLEEKINPNPKVAVPQKYREFLVHLLHEEIEELHGLLGGPVARWRESPGA